MKPLTILLALSFGIFAGGCADPLEQRTGEEVGEQLQRGVTGQGTLGPEQRPAGDPAAEHDVPQTHP
jgi:hypothetical protein